MRTSDYGRLLPHELFFGGFLLVTWMRFVAVEGFFTSDAVVYLLLLSINGVVLAICRQPNEARGRLALLFYPIAMNIIFTHMKAAIPRLSTARADQFLQHVDAFLPGGNLSLNLQRWIQPWSTELFSLCYLMFFPYLFISIVLNYRDDLKLLKKFWIGLFSIYGIGFLGYSLLPAAGPCHAMSSQFDRPLTGWVFTPLNNAIVGLGSNGVDAFPSLHCAVSSFILGFDRRHHPKRFQFWFVPCIGLWVSTIYLRYHYFIDVACGLALAAFALWLSKYFPLAQSSAPLPIQKRAPRLTTHI